MNPVQIIKKKRNGGILSKEEIELFINGYLSGNVKDYQMSAFLMAVYFSGMNDEETFFLTDLMLKSGEIVDLSFIKKAKIDKHSTGGVGDKTSLILAPVAACADICVPMISGRGLGHTGGTLDKLESIPNFNVNLSIEEFKNLLEKNNLALIGQTSQLAPADKKIYAMRDVTATVDNISLITASIISKKIAEGAEGIVFDVKIGNGANLPDVDLSKNLAKNLITVSRKYGKRAIAILTDMTEPLGKKIGNWLEVEECLYILNGSRTPDDLVLVNKYLTGAMIYLGGKSKSIEAGMVLCDELIGNGKAYKKFLETIEYQGGDVDYVKDFKNQKRDLVKMDVISESDGYISEMNAHKFGMASIEIGCGRKKIEDKINYLAGFILNKKVGDKIAKNELLYEIYSDNNESINNALDILKGAVVITQEKPKQKDLIIDILM